MRSRSGLLQHAVRLRTQSLLPISGGRRDLGRHQSHGSARSVCLSPCDTVCTGWAPYSRNIWCVEFVVGLWNRGSASRVSARPAGAGKHAVCASSFRRPPARLVRGRRRGRWRAAAHRDDVADQGHGWLPGEALWHRVRRRSSGTRIHVYTWKTGGGGAKDSFDLVSDELLKIKPGLSSYKERPSDAGASLAP